MSAIIILAIIVLLAIVLKRLNEHYYLLALNKRIRTVSGRPLKDVVTIVPGRTIFGNNFDVIDADMEGMFTYCRTNTKYAKGNSYVLNIITKPVYNVCTAEDAEVVLSSQELLTKGVIYQLVTPFMGDGLLTSTDKKWFSRRKMLTPAFHFNILQSFLLVFKEESLEMVKVINKDLNQPVKLEEIIPEFTLNNVCDTALGVKLSELPGNKTYRNSINEIEKIVMIRLANPLMVIFPKIFRIFGDYKTHIKHLRIAHDFSNKIIQKKREEFQRRGSNTNPEQVDEFGKKRRAAMLDTLLEAEKNGLIDNQGICDEVNTFMFEGYDTTSTCLIFAFLNLACHPDLQEKCYQEICNIDELDKLTLFDFNQMVYLECFIKEVLRMYPSVPFMGRKCMKETVVGDLILPAGTQIHIHPFDVMRDPRHFPDPSRFDPDRFLPENSVNRHPFAYIPFSAGPRNCIGQKFAVLEVKVILLSVLRNFMVLPVTRVEDIVFENGIVLRTKQSVQVKFQKRVTTSI